MADGTASTSTRSSKIAGFQKAYGIVQPLASQIRRICLHNPATIQGQPPAPVLPRWTEKRKISAPSNPFSNTN